MFAKYVFMSAKYNFVYNMRMVVYFLKINFAIVVFAKREFTIFFLICLSCHVTMFSHDQN